MGDVQQREAVPRLRKGDLFSDAGADTGHLYHRQDLRLFPRYPPYRPVVARHDDRDRAENLRRCEPRGRCDRTGGEETDLQCI